MDWKHLIPKDDAKCWLDNDKKNIIPFVPETVPKLIPIDMAMFNKYFPKFKDVHVNKSELQITNVGIYSIARPWMAEVICDAIATRVGRNAIITDALANVGGMTIAFARKFQKVQACEIIPMHCDVLRKNLRAYKVDERKYQVFCKDYMSIMMELSQDVIFFDPPWGGKDYKSVDKMRLGINNMNIACVVNVLLEKARLITVLVPYNFDLDNFREIVKAPIEIVNLTRKDGKQWHYVIMVRGSKAS